VDFPFVLGTLRRKPSPSSKFTKDIHPLSHHDDAQIDLIPNALLPKFNIIYSAFNSMENGKYQEKKKQPPTNPGSRAPRGGPWMTNSAKHYSRIIFYSPPGQENEQTVTLSISFFFQLDPTSHPNYSKSNNQYSCDPVPEFLIWF